MATELTYSTPAPSTDGRPTTDFTWDERDMVATCPKRSLWADLQAATDPEATDTERFRSVRTFIEASLCPEDRAWFRARLRNPDDDLEYDHLLPLLGDLLEGWSSYIDELSAEVGTHDTVKQPQDRKPPSTAAKKQVRQRPGGRRPVKRTA